MPSYFFHLKLELYSTPAATSSRKRQKLSHTSDDSDVFVPPSGSDIFKSRLPAHKTSRWTSYKFPKPAADGLADLSTSRNGYNSGSSERSQSPSHNTLSPPSAHGDSHGDALLLPERSLRLKKDAAAPSRTSTTVKHSNEAAARDWRYDAVEIESIDMENSKSKSGTAGGGLHTKAVYWPSDPKTTEVGWGVVHLYRDSEESSVLDGSAAPHKSLQDGEDGFNPEECTTLCILAVPSWMMPSDLLGFVGDQAREDVSHFRLIRTGRANKYMVLMKFRSAKKARDWQKVYNGRLFSAAEPENCHVVFIKSVEFLSPDDEAGPPGNFPHNTNDPFTAMSNTSGPGKSLLSKPLAPPPPNLLELPTCPVCLERMDETTGLLTILCQHVFHCACLEKWRGSGCPVCRYTHSPSYTFPYPRPDGSVAEDDSEPLCSVCAGTSNLWICLICGNIGCGRYDDAHAYAHYEETSHCYAMDINTQHVWDYAGDGYVHRLIQSKPAPDSSSSRNTIDLPSRTRHENEAFRAEGGDSVPREKMESMAAEYTYLLTSQLEGQRRYFEEQVERAVDKAAQASARAEEAVASVSKANSQLEEVLAERQSISDTLSRLQARLEKTEKARDKFEQMAREMTSKWQTEKSMGEGLLKRIRDAEEKTAEAKKEAAKAREEKLELEEMNRDLSMFISGQEKVKELQEQGEEVVDGSVSLPEGQAGGSGGGGKKKGKGRKK